MKISTFYKALNFSEDFDISDGIWSSETLCAKADNASTGTKSLSVS